MLADLHPSDRALHDFLLGKAPDPVHGELESHLSACAACQDRAASLQISDTFVGLLTLTYARRHAALTPSVAEPSAATFAWQASDSLADGSAELPPVLADHPRYRPVRPIGYGGMGSVWLAEHALMGRQVAVKVIRPDRYGRPQIVGRFIREIQAVGKLDCANIVRAYDAERIGDVCLLVMEYVPGVTLSEELKNGPLPTAEACRAARDAARGLAVAHAAGLIHRDVKPSNLIRTADGVTKVLDFGLATAGAGDVDEPGPDDAATVPPTLTVDQMVIGTPDYIAPEQIADAAKADARADVYALGCTLYHLLSGRVPYPADTLMAKLDAHGNPAVRPAPLVDVPPELAAVVARMMARTPDDRIQTAAEVAAALEPFCEAGRAGGGNLPVSSRRRWPFAVGASIALLLLVVAGVVYHIHREGNEIVTVATDDPAIEVTMKRNGELVRIVDTSANKAWELDTQKMRLQPDGGELSVDLPGREPLVLRRAGQAVVTVRREATTVSPLLLGGPAVEELHHIPFVFAGWHDFAVDGKEFLVTTAQNGKRVAVIFDNATGKEAGRFVVPEGTVVRIWFLPASQDLLVSVDRRLSRWDRQTGKKLQDLFVLPDGPDAGGMVMPLSADGETLVAAAYDAFGPDRHGVFVYDLKTGRERFRVKQLDGQSILGMSPRLSPDGKLLATTDTTTAASTIRLWNVATGEPVKSIAVTGALSAGIEFTRGGREVIASYVSGGRGVLGVWDVATGTQRGQAAVPPHGASDWLRILPLGDMVGVLSASGRTAQFIDSRTGERSGVYRSDEAILTGVASPGGRYVLWVSVNHVLVVRVPSPRKP